MKNYSKFFIITGLIVLLFVFYFSNNKDEKFKNPITIEQIYVIALPKRKQYMLKLLKHFNLNGQFVEPILKDYLDRNYLIKKNILHKNYLKQGQIFKQKESGNFSGLTNGRIACHLSHMKTLKTFLDSNKKNCLIFEDDIKMTDPKITIAKFKQLLQYLPNNWEYVNLGRCWDKCKNDLQINKCLVKSERALCRHAYIVNRKGAQKILNHCLPMRGYPGDWHYAKMTKYKLINGYSSIKPIFFQNRNMGSNIGNGSFNQPTCI
tara:strand:+ start:765 stop:1553 length:789 start_codon:yes stop_codon:yes gene_type:complete